MPNPPFNLPGARVNPVPQGFNALNAIVPVAPGAASTCVAPTSALRGMLPSAAAVRQYVEAGSATLTVVSIRTGTRYTFKFKRPDAKPGEPPHARPVWVSLLSGPDNEGDYSFLGTCFPDVAKGAPVPVGTPFRYRHSIKSKVDAATPSVRALTWLLTGLYATLADMILTQAECWHEGRCGRCGRALTVPASIASGFGPECIQHVAAPQAWQMPAGHTPNPAYTGPVKV